MSILPRRARALAAASPVTCSRCGADAGLRGNRGVRRPYCSKRCQQQDWYDQVGRARFESGKLLIRQARTGSCVDCGRDDLPWEAMDLDHVPERGPKLFNLTEGAQGTVPRLLRELEKCDRVCPTCHRLRSLARDSFVQSGRSAGRTSQPEPWRSD